MSVNKIKVLVVSSKYPPEYSGSGLRAHNTYKRLREKFPVDFDVVASSLTSNSCRDYILDSATVKVISSKKSNRIDKKDSDGFFRKIFIERYNKFAAITGYFAESFLTFLFLLKNRSRYDIFHVFGSVPVTAAAIMFAKIMRKPLIVEIVNLVDKPPYSEPRLISRLWGRGYPANALIVCISEYLKRVCLEYGYREEQIWCRPNPVDEEHFYYARENRAAARRTIGDYAPSDIVLLYLAAFIPRKKQDFITETMAFLPDMYKLVLAGPLVDTGPNMRRDHEYFDTINRIISTQGLQSRIKLVPDFIENPETLFQAADVFVMPAVGEGLGTPFLEALACGIPVVANHIPGVFDVWIRDGRNGFLCDNFDHSLWAEKIIQASRIDHGIMKGTSEEILHKASTAVIDQQYYSRILALIDRTPI